MCTAQSSEHIQGLYRYMPGQRWCVCAQCQAARTGEKLAKPWQGSCSPCAWPKLHCGRPARCKSGVYPCRLLLALLPQHEHPGV